MNRRSLISLTVAVLAGAVLLAGSVVAIPILALLDTAAQASVCGAPPIAGATPPEPGTAHDKWDARQVTNAAVIVSVGKQMDVPAWGYVIALGAAMQESRLLNHANDNPAYPQVAALSMALPHEAVGHDNDSVGLFQQRPIEGAGSWGTVQELMTPNIAARKFYTALLKVPGWEQMRLTDAAQAVQRSGYPEAYQKHEADAKALAAHVLGLPNIDMIGGGGPAAPCGTGAFEPVPVGPNGWVQPLDKKFVVGPPFGQDRGDHKHAGVDIVGADIRGEPIRAAADATVIRVVCNTPSNNCDRDGGIGVGGCGWYADLRHPGNVVTRYCHMIQRPSVQEGQSIPAGTVIGFVGSSGNSSGPHLHFEVHTNVTDGERLSYANAVDPVQFMAAQQAPLPVR
ncbi:M23 family metallopeptidase [Actinoplanes subglobosus]|uniref:M23 family metallopeptidase n=1 Tax=Actinoplanes subglobosus TaxID=1547892 RepID=A0ABV8ITX4_9ACTN